jgi:hypothetical protein
VTEGQESTRIREKATQASKSILDSLLSFWRRGTVVERTGYRVGVLLLASGLIHLLILVTSGASWEGPLSLRKPATFGLSFGLTLVTIVWVTTFLELGKQTRAILLTVFTAACTLETALVSLQAWRHVPSHFNIGTPFDARITRLLAGGGVALVVVILILTVAAFQVKANVPISLRLAIRVGFVTLLAAQITGAAMIARGMRLVFQGEPQAAYARGGMLKPTHAVLMHGVFVLPALAWLLTFANWTERRRLGLVLAAAAVYLALAGAVVRANVAALYPSNRNGPQSFESRPTRVVRTPSSARVTIIETGQKTRSIAHEDRLALRVASRPSTSRMHWPRTANRKGFCKRTCFGSRIWSWESRSREYPDMKMTFVSG